MIIKKTPSGLIKSWEKFPRFLLNKKNYYKVYYKRKSNRSKWRKICIPSADLKCLQRELLEWLNDIPIPEYIHGFVRGKSVGTNSVGHTKKPLVISFDIENFFDSTTRFMIIKALKIAGFNTEICEDIADATMFEGGLPQGAPTSPLLANVAFLPIDKKLNMLAKANAGTYSRYADDITISSYDRGAYDIIRYIENIIADHGYKINKKKTRFKGRGDSQVVAGLVVNEKSQPAHKYRRNIKAKLHNLVNGQQRPESSILPVLNGECNWIKIFNKNFYDRHLKHNLEKLEGMI